MPILTVPLSATTQIYWGSAALDGCAAQGAPRSFAFGPFILEPERQLLLKDGARVRVGGRALDILTALVERPGEVLSKRELLSLGWPNIFVEEANLKVTVASLRRIFGERPEAPQFIATLAGRGYRFIALVRILRPATPSLITRHTRSYSKCILRGSHALAFDEAPACRHGHGMGSVIDA